MNQEYWDCKALLLRILEGKQELVNWMCCLRTFNMGDDPGNPSYDACLLVGIEPTDENKTALAFACERLTKCRANEYTT